MAKSREEEQRRRRRKRLTNGLLVGGAAVGIPALLNSLVSRRAKRLPVASWSQEHPFDWHGHPIHYQRLGDPESSPVLLLHGFGPGHSGLEWRLAAEILAQQHQVFVPDLLGWGASATRAPVASYDSELYLRLIADFLKQVVERRAVVIAAGLPAAYAAQLSVDMPESIRGLGLVVPLGLGMNGDEPDLKDAVVHRMLRLPVLGTSALNVFTSRSGIANYLEREVFADRQIATALIDEFYRLAHQPGAHSALAAYLSGYLNHGVLEILGRIGQPVWIAWGRHTSSPPVETADLWLRRLPDADFEVFEHSGMMPHREHPEGFCHQLEFFLSKLSS